MKRILIASWLVLCSIISPMMVGANPFDGIEDKDELLQTLKTESDKIINNFKGTKAKEKKELKKHAQNILGMAEDLIDTSNENQSDDESTPEDKTATESRQKQKPTDAEIQELKKKAEAAHEREHSKANKMLGAAGIGATGIGGMMLMQGLSEQSSDADAEEQMRAYLSTFMCKYGDNSVQAGASDVELPGGNALLPLYSEYVTLANDVKAMKNELGLKPGIESESILDSATSGLYDDVSTGKNSGAFASLSRALMNPEGEDAKKWADQTAKTQKNVKTGAITAGAGVAVGIIGDIAISAIDKKKAEKADKDSDDDDNDDDESSIDNFKQKLKEAGVTNVDDLDLTNLDASELNNLIKDKDFSSIQNLLSNKSATDLFQTSDIQSFTSSLSGLFNNN